MNMRLNWNHCSSVGLPGSAPNAFCPSSRTFSRKHWICSQ